MRKRAWRTRRHKLIEALEPDFHNLPTIELYDLADDPGEQRNVAEQHPDLVKELLGRMEAHAARRLSRTKLPDPVQTQRITLTKIGEMKTAVPENQKLAGAER
jgi:hypothetical protein